MCRKGFTMIEMLVIVLIIGILAAVALPIYNNAVAQSRFSALMPNAKALKEAQERMFLSSSKYTDSFDNLDLSFSGTVTNGKLVSGDEIFSIENTSEDSSAKNTIVASHAKVPNVNLVMYLSRSPNFAEDVHCEAKSSDEKANHLCQLQNENMIGTRDGYNVYLMSGSGEGKLNSWPKTGECQTNAQYGNCQRHTNEDGSYNETFIKNGREMDYHYDKDGNLTYATQNVTEQGMFVEAWFENGNRIKQTQTYEDGRVATWTYDENGNKIDMKGYENGNLKQLNTYDENGAQTSTVVYWSDNPGTVQFYNTYENGEYVAQTKYWPDGSVRGYYTIVNGKDDGQIAVEYNKDGSVNYTSEYSSPGVVDRKYYYNADGTWVSKPNSDSVNDQSTWTYGTYTTGNNGDITRSDGVTIPGSANYPNLCTSHPDQGQCAA